MITVNETIENRRLRLQAALDSAKSQAARNKLGQFATPTALADDILKLAVSILPGKSSVRFLDPAFGTGSFFSALLRSVPQDRIESAKAYEIDPHYAEPAKALWRGAPLQLTMGDFTAATPPPDQKDKATLVICNPPYVRHHHLPPDFKQRLHAASLAAAGVDLNGLTGLYCHFVTLSHPWMAKDAVAVWLVPSEFMDVNYGRPLKQYLLQSVTLLRIHRFDPAEVQFDDALVSSAVVVFRNAPPLKPRTVQFTYGGSLANPAFSRSILNQDLRPEAKWTRLTQQAQDRTPRGDSPKLADLFIIKRGIATGANDFFVLTSSRAQELGIPGRFLKPILPSPRFLGADEIAADLKGNPAIEPVRMLLDCRLPEENIRKDFPRLWSYLEVGRSLGIHKRYLCTHRQPWYSQEHRDPAPILCTYMGRVRTRKGAFRFILNHSKAIAANVYLMLYPKPAFAAVLRDRPAAIRAVWMALNEIPWQALMDVGRVYGGGLHKMEPKELAEAPAQTLLAALPEAAPTRQRQLNFYS